MNTTSFGDIHATRHSDYAATRGAALLSEVVEAHGGGARWAKAQTVSSHVQVRGLLPTWKFPGRPLEDYHYHQKVYIDGLRHRHGRTSTVAVARLFAIAKTGAAIPQNPLTAHHGCAA